MDLVGLGTRDARVAGRVGADHWLLDRHVVRTSLGRERCDGTQAAG